MAAAGAGARPVVVSLIAPRPPAPVLTAQSLRQLEEAGWVVRQRPLPPGSPPEALPEAVGADATAVLCSWGTPAFTPAVLARLPALRFIGYCAGSVKRLVTPQALERGITVVSAAPVIARGVAEYCLAVLLWTLRELGPPSAALAARSGSEGWLHPPGAHSLWGRPVGLVSASQTARALIPLLAAFGCPITVYDPYLDEAEARVLGVARGSLRDVCRQPVVSVHAPDLPTTRGLIGAAELACIPDGGVFINAARAAVVDVQALVAELRRGRFRAVLDVFPEEPLPADSPLRGLPHVLLTPHIAGYSADIYADIGRQVVAELLRWQAGAPLRLAVDPRRWEIMA